MYQILIQLRHYHPLLTAKGGFFSIISSSIQIKEEKREKMKEYRTRLLINSHTCSRYDKSIGGTNQ